MDWREKSVTLGSVKKERFNTHLAHITVSETRVTVTYKDVDDWKRIRREVGTGVLPDQIAIEDIRDIDTSEEHLYYPHINLIVETDDGTEEKRIYFVEDEEDMLHDCRNAINRFWNTHRQRGAPHRDSYRYGDDEREDGEGAEAEEGEGADREEGPGGSGPVDEEPVEDVELEAALRKQNSLTHRLSEGIKNEAAHFKKMLTGGSDKEDAEEAGQEPEQEPAEGHDHEAEPPAEAAEEHEDEGGSDEAKKKGLMEKISDEYRSEIDKFRHIGKDGQPKDDKGEDEDEDDGDDGDEENGDEEDGDAGSESAVDAVVDRLTDQ